MYLKSIEVQGFKSFAHKTLLEFHNGITCIVGPNGSGKSNVADAVRWVLGEQSARQLRSYNMQDVIFSGTENRKAQGFASVAITFDNSDRQLAIDYKEVTVARRVYRSGESEYLLNGAQCRLRDINELFYDTGIGQEGYSIIGQGQIDKILSNKPEERRELFDEAAGIVKYKRRKTAAQRRLDNEEANMVRISDALYMLEKQVGPLERQSKDAREYLRLHEELRQYEVNAFVLETNRIEAAKEEAQKAYEVTSADAEATKAETEELKARYAEKQEALEQLDAAVTDLHNSLTEKRTEKQEKESGIQLAESAMETIRTRISAAGERLAFLAQDTVEKENQAAEFERRRQDCGAQIYDWQVKEDFAANELEEVRLNVLSHQETVKENQGMVISLLTEKSSLTGELQKQETLLEQNGQKREELKARLLSGRETEQSWQKEEASRQAAYDATRKSRAELAARQDELRTKSEESRKTLAEARDRFYEQRRLHQVTLTRAESLRNMAERYEGYGSSIRAVMEKRTGYPGIKGVVADLIHVDKKYETAIETALGGAIQNIVTDTEQTAKALIGYLKEKKLGRATFLPMDAITVRDEFRQKDALKEKGIIGLGSSLVHCDKEYGRLAEYLLGRILVADTVDHAMKVSAKYHRSLRIVTLEGELLSPGGSMTGGAFRNATNLLGRNRELEELEKQAAQEEKELDECEAAFTEAAKEAENLEKAAAKAVMKLSSLNLEETKCRLSLSEAQTKLRELREESEEYEGELGALDKEASDIRGERQRILDMIDTVDKKGDQSRTTADRSQETVNEALKRQDELTGILTEAQLERAKLEQEQNFLVERLEGVRQEMARQKDESRQLTEQCKEDNRELEARRSAQEQLKAEALRLGSEITEQESVLEEKTAERTKANRELSGFFTRQEELSERLSVLDKECMRLSHVLEKQEEQLDAMTDSLWNEYEIRPSEAKEAFDPNGPKMSEIRPKIKLLKNQMKALGNVNVGAIEEYKKVSEEYSFMKTQHDDLVESRKSLIGVIAELDEAMRRQFAEKFAQINKEFDSVFKELFGGGSGTLELTEGEDILEAGIRITSQPPGKKLQNMMQLSGGEKALTAIALMFAIQNLKPSPFCLLDEIEAALDDSNVGRFAAYLHKLTKTTQFIVITHRRGTMTSADRLYGITMQEKGVSTLVSVNLVESSLS